MCTDFCGCREGDRKTDDYSANEKHCEIHSSSHQECTCEEDELLVERGSGGGGGGVWIGCSKVRRKAQLGKEEKGDKYTEKKEVEGWGRDRSKPS